jgi:hypothetical protein
MILKATIQNNFKFIRMVATQFYFKSKVDMKDVLSPK